MNLSLTSSWFLFFLPLVVVLYYVFRGNARVIFLLAINILFYCSFGPVFVLVMLGESIILWVYSLIMGNCTDIRLRNVWMWVFITLYSITLISFKVLPLKVEGFIAPLGISFYSLQAISYIVDVKRKIIESQKNPIVLLSYLSFFVTVTSGPIYRYSDYIVEFERAKKLRADYFRIVNGIVYMLYGYFLKFVIAERASVPVNTVFDSVTDPEGVSHGSIVLVIAAVVYSLQIYADFAGYSAIVIGIAQILGYKIPENFTAPYLSLNVKEFWRRWHISFSSWLKDYIYIPLGGNRKGRIRKYINIMVTFLISGVWHGINGFHFLVWGGLHGIYQVVGDITENFRKRIKPRIGIVPDSFFDKLISRIITFSLVSLAWIFFRLGVRSSLKYVFGIIANRGLSEIKDGVLLTLGLGNFEWIVLVVAIMVMFLIDIAFYSKKERIDDLLNGQGSLARCLFIIIISLTILIFGIYGPQHPDSYFIYRDF